MTRLLAGSAWLFLSACLNPFGSDSFFTFSSRDHPPATPFEPLTMRAEGKALLITNSIGLPSPCHRLSATGRRDSFTLEFRVRIKGTNADCLTIVDPRDYEIRTQPLSAGVYHIVLLHTADIGVWQTIEQDISIP